MQLEAFIGHIWPVHAGMVAALSAVAATGELAFLGHAHEVLELPEFHDVSDRQCRRVLRFVHKNVVCNSATRMRKWLKGKLLRESRVQRCLAQMVIHRPGHDQSVRLVQEANGNGISRGALLRIVGAASARYGR